ncbi:MAG: class I tRNA ligase family protein, partial [Anaerolineae bacterium]|nr:class I tRNA ligase family protein [Anaerolineae bacterium]
EIAQSEHYTGTEFARFWVHCAMLRYQGEKMSKSLGNMVFARDLLKTVSADAIRLALLSHHYRDSWEYTDADLQRAVALAERLRLAGHAGGGSAGRSLSSVHTVGAQDYVTRFTAALDNDLDTPAALQVLDELAAEVQSSRDSADALRQLAAVLGLRLDAPGPEPRVVEGWTTHRQRFE